MILVQFIDDNEKIGIRRGDIKNVADDVAIELIKKGIARKVHGQSETDEARLSARLRDTPTNETR